MPPASNMMYRHHQQPPPPAMLPPLYGSVSAGYGASSSAKALQQGAVSAAGAGSSSSSTPRGGVSVAGMGGISSSISSSVMTSPVSAGMQLGSSAGSNMGLAAAAASLPPTIPESYSGDAILDQQGPGSLAGSSSSGMGGGSEYGVAAAAGQADVESGSPLARRRSGYRSSLRKVRGCAARQHLRLHVCVCACLRTHALHLPAGLYGIAEWSRSWAGACCLRHSTVVPAAWCSSTSR